MFTVEKLLIVAAEIERVHYGRLRMVKEVTVFDQTFLGERLFSQAEGLSAPSDQNVKEFYSFEDISPDLDSAVEYEELTAFQTSLRQIFEAQDKEGIGSNPDPEPGISQQFMTWFYPSTSKGLDEFGPEEAAYLLESLEACAIETEFHERAKAACIVTFTKHMCDHEWDGDSDDLECQNCEEHKFV
ncbi:MAG: hypothetical protein RL384_676 [Actinomycetota bacterium]|jgi:hypothetical protein